MTELGIEEKSILSALGLDVLPVHIRRKTDYMEPDFIDTCYVECFGHVLAVYHKRDNWCYIKELYRLRIHKDGVTATQILDFSGFEADTAMGFHPAEPAYRARLLKRLNEGIAKFKSLARLSVAVASYAHVGISPDYGSQFRIVELKNGLYEVQQFRCKWDGLSSLKEWTRPEDDRMNTFNTLEEARDYKERLVARMLEQEGFSIKRVVE